MRKTLTQADSLDSSSMAKNTLIAVQLRRSTRADQFARAVPSAISSSPERIAA